MLDVHYITSFDLPELAPYRTLRFQMEQREQGIFVAEKVRVVRLLLQSALPVVSLLLPKEWLATFQEDQAHRPEKIQAFVAEKSLLEQLTGYAMYQGVMAVCKVPPALSIEALLQNAPRPWLLVATDGVNNAQNMGVMVRNCAAFSAGALLTGETSCSPYLRRAVSASAGNIFSLPTLELTCLRDTLREFRKRGIRCIAAHPHAEGRTLAQANFTGDCCIVLGSEGEGISAAVLEECDEAVAIPMPPTVDSLNVGSASAVFLYEAARQRNTRLAGSS